MIFTSQQRQSRSMGRGEGEPQTKQEAEKANQEERLPVTTARDFHSIC